MNNDQSFSERYKKLSDTELLLIIRNSANYQPAAITAANIEWESRRLSQDQVDAIDEELDYEKRAGIVRKQGRDNLYSSVRRTIWPEDAAERHIRKIAYSVGLFYILIILTGDWMVLKMMLEPSNYDFETLLFFIPYILIPVGALSFGLKKKAGWIILTFVVTHLTIQSLYLTVRFNDIPKYSMSYRELIQYLGVLFLTVISLLLYRINIRQKFNISIKTMVITIVASSVLFLIQIITLR